MAEPSEDTKLTDDPGAFWDDKFKIPDYRYGTEPNAFLAERLPGLVEPGARVLCVGDGEGRNGVWCAQQGYQATSLEPSKVGREKTAALAARRGVEVAQIADTMPSEQVKPESFDAVVLCYIHTPAPRRPDLHRACAAAVRPGGVVLLEGFTPAQLANQRPSGGPSDVAMMFTAEMLAGDFEGFEIEHLVEEEVELAEGDGHRGPADVVRMIARKR